MLAHQGAASPQVGCGRGRSIVTSFWRLGKHGEVPDQNGEELPMRARSSGDTMTKP